MKGEQHRCEGMYYGMTKIGGLILLAYRCSDMACGRVWGQKVSPEEAYRRHPHLLGDTQWCENCKKYHKPPVGKAEIEAAEKVAK